MSKVYDVLIIGAGPAGLSAGIYAGRARLSTLIIEKEKDGGQIVLTSEVENYPGCLEGESGPTLVDRMAEQAKHFGVEKVYDEIVEVKLEGKEKILIGKKGEYKGKAVIIASGATSRPIGCPGEKTYTGKGVSYCATCDAAFFEDLEVFVVGGGDTAVEEALYLTKFARKVSIIHRRDELRASKTIVDKAKSNKKIHFLLNNKIIEFQGEERLAKVVIQNNKTNILKDINVSAVFEYVGIKPNSALLKDIVELDELGFVVTNKNLETSMPGIFAAGDVRNTPLRQVITAVADGAVSATSAEKYLS